MTPPEPPPPSDALRDALRQIRWVHLDFVHEALGDLLLPQDDLRPAFAGDLWNSLFGLCLSQQRVIPGALEQLRRPATGSEPRLPQWALQGPVVGDGIAPAGALLRGRITLLGSAIQLLPASVAALALFESCGAGPARVPLTLRGVALAAQGEEAMAPADPLDPAQWRKSMAQGLGEAAMHDALRVWEAPESRPPARPGHVAVLLPSPLALHQDNRPLRTAPTFRQLVSAVQARVAGLAPAGLPLGLFAPGEKESWQQWAEAVPALRAEVREAGNPEHWSGTQRRTHPVTGIAGQCLFGRPASAALPWLRLGEALQVGGKVTHGCGVLRAMLL